MPSLIRRLRNVISSAPTGEKVTDNLAAVFQSHAPLGNHPAAWADDPTEQVRHYRHWVYAAVRAIASRVAGTTLNFTRSDTGEALAPSHPLPELMQRVNPFETAVSLWMRTMTFLELTGNAYWFVARNALGRPVELWLLPSQYMRVIPSRDTFVSGYLYRHGGIEESFSTEEIIHLKYPSPESVYYGKGPLQAAASSVDSHESMKEAERRSFEQGVFPGVAVQTSEKLSGDVRRRLEETLRRGFSGPKRAGRALVLEQGLTLRPFTFSPREMDFLESSKMTRDEILATFGVPAAVAGIIEDVNRASAEAMLYTFAENTILPKLRLLASQLTQDLCARFDPRIIATFESPVPRARADERADMMARMRFGITTVNEERQRLGLKPLPGGNVPVNEKIKPENEKNGNTNRLTETLLQPSVPTPTKARPLPTLTATADTRTDPSAELTRTLAHTLKGQLRRLEEWQHKSGQRQDAIKGVIDSPEEPSRLIAPLVPAITAYLREKGITTGKRGIRKFAEMIAARCLCQARSVLTDKNDRTLNEIFEEEIIPAAQEAAVMLLDCKDN